MRKVDDGKKRKEKKKIMSFLVATNVVASRPPERQPTGTPHARAKNGEKKDLLMKIMANTPLPAVDRPNADRWNAARTCQLNSKS